MKAVLLMTLLVVLGLVIQEAKSAPCICQLIYSPVCGTDGNTYDNACNADCAGVNVDYTGACTTTTSTTTPASSDDSNESGEGNGGSDDGDDNGDD